MPLVKLQIGLLMERKTFEQHKHQSQFKSEVTKLKEKIFFALSRQLDFSVFMFLNVP